MKKTSARGHSTLNELNITPLLDLVFVLLVIFIITTPQMVNSLEMALPSGKPPPVKPDAPKPKINHLTVAADGRYLLNEQPETLETLRAKLRQMKAENPDVSVVVEGAEEVDYQNMINVLDILQQLEITKVGLATQAPD